MLGRVMEQPQAALGNLHARGLHVHANETNEPRRHIALASQV